MFAINLQDSNTTILFRCVSKQGQQVKKNITQVSHYKDWTEL